MTTQPGQTCQTGQSETGQTGQTIWTGLEQGQSGPEQGGLDDGRPDPGLSAIMSERRRLINLAYRLLGSLADAEDVVQETYVRWYAMSHQEQEAIESPGAWLTKVAMGSDQTSR